MEFPSRKVLLVVLAAVLLHAGMLAIYAHKYGDDVSAFVGASHRAKGQPPLELVTASIGPGGYDGMFYYTIARNPWVPHPQSLDAPAFRHVRVLYPVLCWALSAGGKPYLLLWVMPLVNLLAIAGMAWLGAAVAWKYGLSPWWGLVVPLSVSACIPAARNLTDNLSTLAVFALLAAWLLDRPWWQLTLLALAAVFTREQNILAVGVVLVAAGLSRRFTVAAGMAGALAVWFGWITYLKWVYGTSPLDIGPKVFGPPLGGLVYAWTHLGGYHDSKRLAMVNALSLLHMAVFLALGAYVVWQRRSAAVVLVVLASTAMALLATDVLWNDLISYRRALVWLPLGIWLAGVQARERWLLLSLAPAGLFSLAVALRYA